MNALVEIANENGVSLQQILAARDQRVVRQSAAMIRFEQPLVSMTVVMPGPVKDGPLPRRVLQEARCELNALARTKSWPVLWREVYLQPAGPEAIYVMETDPSLLKSATVELEDRHPLGRLWDLDVIAPQRGGLSRRALGLRPRRCLVCHRPAFECSRSRRHPLQELLNNITKIVDEHDYANPA